MSESRKTTTGFWAACILLAGLALYPLSIGPFIAIVSRVEDLPEPVEQVFGVIYAPLEMVVEMLPDVMQQPVYAYMELWVPDESVLASSPATVPGPFPTAPLPPVVGVDFDFTFPPAGAKGVVPIAPTAPVAKAPLAGTAIQAVSFETDTDSDVREDEPAAVAVSAEDDVENEGPDEK